MKRKVLKPVQYVNYRGEVVKPLPYERAPVRDYVLKKEFWTGVMRQEQKRAVR